MQALHETTSKSNRIYEVILPEFIPYKLIKDKQCLSFSLNNDKSFLISHTEKEFNSKYSIINEMDGTTLGSIIAPYHVSLLLENLLSNHILIKRWKTQIFSIESDKIVLVTFIKDDNAKPNRGYIIFSEETHMIDDITKLFYLNLNIGHRQVSGKELWLFAKSK